MHYVLRSLLVGLSMCLVAGIFACLLPASLLLTMGLASLTCAIAVLGAGAILWFVLKDPGHSNPGSSNAVMAGREPGDFELFELMREQAVDSGGMLAEDSFTSFFCRDSTSMSGPFDDADTSQLGERWADQDVYEPTNSFIQRGCNLLWPACLVGSEASEFEMVDVRHCQGDCYF